MKRTVFLSILALMPLILGCGSVGVSSSRLRSARLTRYPPPPSARTIQTGDRLDIYLQGIPEPKVIAEEVDERGTVKLPHLGVAHIGGLTTGQAEDTIEKAYVDAKIYREGAIQVVVVPPVSEFYVRGQVHRPGSYQFTRNLTVLQAVSIAGGPNEFAHKAVWKLSRKGKTHTIDVGKVRSGKEPDQFIEPGDVIEVPRGWM